MDGAVVMDIASLASLELDAGYASRVADAAVQMAFQIHGSICDFYGGSPETRDLAIACIVGCLMDVLAEEACDAGYAARLSDLAMARRDGCAPPPGLTSWQDAVRKVTSRLSDGIGALSGGDDGTRLAIGSALVGGLAGDMLDKLGYAGALPGDAGGDPVSDAVQSVLDRARARGLGMKDTSLMLVELAYAAAVGVSLLYAHEGDFDGR